VKQHLLFTNDDIWSLFAIDDKTVMVGKKDGTVDIFDVISMKMIGTYKLRIKSGVQDISRNS
jgi:hypothetical protein